MGPPGPPGLTGPPGVSTLTKVHFNILHLHNSRHLVYLATMECKEIQEKMADQ